jgi:tRNA pseudouridine13 synthase
VGFLQVPKLERDMGIEVYATNTAGIGGVIRESVEDFMVEEVLVDGSKAQIRPLENHTELRVLDSSLTKNTHLLCVLVKRNWDTFMAMRTVAKHLGIPSSRIHFAGIKDAKAVTAQHVTIQEVTFENVRKVSMRDIELRPVGYLRHPLSSYYLMGNSFRITISQTSHGEATIRQQIAETARQLGKMGGAPNFYGHQRFGTTRPITHIVGKALVRGNIRQAAMLFLAEPFPDEHPESQQARKQLRETQDFQKALEEFPNQLRYERFMLRRLVEKPDDFVGAFRTLPPRLRMLFVQAYQSYLFNKSLSMRITNGLPVNRAVA